MRGLFKSLVVITIFLVICGLVINLIIDNQYMHRWARRIINEQLEQHTKVKIEYESASLSFMPIKLRLFGVVVSDAVDAQQTLLKASQISASISFIDILLGHRRVHEVSFVDLNTAWPPPKPFESYIKNPQLPKPTPKKQEGFRWPPATIDVPVHQIRLSNANISLVLENNEPGAPHSKIEVGMGGIDLRLWMHSWTSAELNLTVNTLNYADQSSFILDNAFFSTRAILSSDSLVLKALNLQSKRLDTKGDVKIRLLSKSAGETKTDEVMAKIPKLGGATEFVKGISRAIEKQKGPKLIYGMNLSADLKVNGEASLAGILFDIKDTYGPFSSQVKLKYDQLFRANAAPNVGGAFSLRSSDTVISGFSLLNSEIKGKFDKHSMSFDEVKLMQNQNLLATASGKLGFDDSVPYEFDIQSEKLALSDLMYALKVSFDTLDFDFGTNALKLKGRGQPFEMQVNGPAKVFKLDVPILNLTSAQLQKSPLCDLDFNFYINSQKISFDNTNLKCRPQNSQNISLIKMGGGITLGDKPVTDLVFTSDQMDLANVAFLTPGDLFGSGPLDVRMLAANDSFTIKANVDFRALGYNQLRLGHVRGQLEVVDDILKWGTVDATYPKGGTLTLTSGQLKFNDNLDFSSGIKALNIGSELFEEVVPLAEGQKPNPQSSTCTFGLDAVSGFLQGPLKKLFLWQGDISAHISNLKCGTETLFDSAKLIVVADSSAIDISRIQVQKDTLFLKGRGSIARSVNAQQLAQHRPKFNALYDLGYSDRDQLNFIFDIGKGALDSNLGLTGPVKAVTEKDLASLPVIGSILSSAGVAGEIDAQILITGTLTQPLASFNTQIYNISFAGNYLNPLYIKGDYQGSKLNTNIKVGKDQLIGEFKMDTDGSMPFEFNTKFSNLDLRPFLGGFAYGDDGNKIWIDGSWRQRGQLSSFWRSHGRLEIAQFGANLTQRSGYQSNQLKFGLSKPTVVEISDGRWEINSEDGMRIKGDLLEAQLRTGDNRPLENLDIKFNGIMDMRVLQLFSREIEFASGKILFNGSVGGKIGDIKLNGLIEDQKISPMIASTFQPVSIGFASIRPKFDNIDLKVRFNEKYLFLDKLAAKKGVGEVSAQGKLTLDSKLPDLNSINIQLNHASVSFPVKLLKSIDAIVSGNLTLTGNKKPYMIVGKVDVVKARSYRNFDIQEEIINLIAEKNFSLQTLQSQASINFDIDINADRSIRIANKTIQSLISANLHLYGSDVKPLLSGQVEIHRGKFYYKRDFVLSPSYVTFDDPTQINPSLDISSIADAGSYRVYLDVGGRLRSPQVDLRTDPSTHPDGGEITRLDILVLLSTGRLPDRNRTVGEAQDVALVEAVSLIAGRFEEPLQKIFDISGQSIVREPYPDAELTDTGQMAGRLNLPIVYKDINAVVRINTAQEWEIISEYPLSDNISLTGSMEGHSGQSINVEGQKQDSNKSNAAIDLKFRFNFP